MRHSREILSAVMLACVAPPVCAQACPADKSRDCRDCPSLCSEPCMDSCKDNCRTADCRADCKDFCRGFCRDFCRDLHHGPAYQPQQCPELGIQAAVNCLCVARGLVSPSPIDKALGVYCAPDCVRGSYETARCYSDQRPVEQRAPEPARGLGSPRGGLAPPRSFLP